MKRAIPLVLVTTTGCALFQPGPVVENRFRSAPEEKGEVPTILIAATTAPVEVDPGGIKITQLSDRAQAALVTETKGKPPIKLKAGDNDEAPVVSYRDSLERHIIVSVRPKTFLGPGDRIDAIRVELTVRPDQRDDWRITGWTFASNGQKVIDVGKLTDVSAAKLEASSSIKAVDFLPDAKVGGEVSRSQTRELNVKDTTDFDAAVDADGRAWLDETAGWRESLAHNLSMDAIISAPAARLKQSYVVASSKLTRDDPASKGETIPALPSSVSLTETAIFTHYKEAEPVCGVAKLTYRIRHIVNPKAQGTFTESDDVVRFVTGNAETSFLLAPAPYEPSYSLQTGSLRLSYVPDGGGLTSLVFATREDAIAFRDWVRSVLPQGGKLANATFGIKTAKGYSPGITRDQAKELIAVIANPQRAAEAISATKSRCLPPPPSVADTTPK